ncbi:MAG: methionyl-tRNA formyltransferase, partial [Candidatus Levybacteria bacterium]|nr:methionyl-tRNA formyltransferase [Candidatus Levybacteria bacterium]
MQNYNSKCKITFFGTSKFAIPVLEVLRTNFELILVITTDPLNGAVPSYCKQNSIPYLSVQQLSNQTIEQLRRANTPLAILASFGLIIPKEVLGIFSKGIFNIHPSLLPKYRGPTPVQTAILNGDKETGVTIIKLDKEVDHGPILAQAEEQVFSTDTSESLYKRLFEKGAQLLLEVLPKHIDGKIMPKEQDHSKATFSKHLTRQDGYIDLANPPLKDLLERMIRAYYPWPGVYTKLKIKNEKLKIIKFLPEGKIQVEGKKPMSYK